jgi:hypothetical protein
LVEQEVDIVLSDPEFRDFSRISGFGLKSSRIIPKFGKSGSHDSLL